MLPTSVSHHPSSVLSPSAVSDSYSFDVFGAIRSQTGISGNYWLFTGEQRDSDSSLYFLRARYYDPAIGRFLGRDPLSIGNQYSYVSNHPVNYIDPYGLIDLTPAFVDDALGWSWDKISDAADCLGDFDCAKEVSVWLDKQAAWIQTMNARVSNLITIAGCAVGGSTGGVDFTIPGCLLGKGLGEIVTTWADQLSNAASILGTATGCLGSLLNKEGGGWSSNNIEACAKAITLTTLGTIPHLSEDNLNAFFANYQYYCLDKGECDIVDIAKKPLTP